MSLTTIVFALAMSTSPKQDAPLPPRDQPREEYRVANKQRRPRERGGVLVYKNLVSPEPHQETHVPYDINVVPNVVLPLTEGVDVEYF